MSQRLLSNQLKQSPILPRQASPPRSNSTAGGVQVGTIASGSTPSLYRPISSVHQSRKDLGIQAPSASRVTDRNMTPLQSQIRGDARFPKSRLLDSDIDPAGDIDIDVEDEVLSLRQENQDLKERIRKLEVDQTLILDLNQLLLQKLYLLTGLVYPTGVQPPTKPTPGLPTITTSAGRASNTMATSPHLPAYRP